jgi:NitT/TauT family transport system permease protein
MRKLSTIRSVALPLAVVVAMMVIWTLIWRSGIFHESAFPAPFAVLRAFRDEIRSGQLFTDLITSLFRVSCGFALAVVAGIPAGLWMGHKEPMRTAFLPVVNFFRNLSPLAWIPFAILWFGVGDASPIFLIFLSAFFPVVLSTMAAAANVPTIYSRVAKDFGMTDSEKLVRVTLPAIMPQVVTTLRVTAGVCWLVVVAAEMIAGRDGLGFAVMDSRNGLRTDILVVEMIVIGLVGVGIDRALVQLTKVPSIRWGYER